jgi:hypothetical protein
MRSKSTCDAGSGGDIQATRVRTSFPEKDRMGAWPTFGARLEDGQAPSEATTTTTLVKFESGLGRHQTRLRPVKTVGNENSS